MLSDTGSGRPSSVDSSHYAVMMGMTGSGLIYVLCTCTSWLSSERKLRPKPFGRGHVCLGVTHRCPPQTSVRVGRKLASRACLRARLAQKRVLGDERHDNRWFFYPRSSSCVSRRQPAPLRPPPLVRAGRAPAPATPSQPIWGVGGFPGKPLSTTKRNGVRGLNREPCLAAHSLISHPQLHSQGQEEAAL